MCFCQHLLSSHYSCYYYYGRKSPGGVCWPHFECKHVLRRCEFDTLVFHPGCECDAVRSKGSGGIEKNKRRNPTPQGPGKDNKRRACEGIGDWRTDSTPIVVGSLCSFLLLYFRPQLLNGSYFINRVCLSCSNYWCTEEKWDNI